MEAIGMLCVAVFAGIGIVVCGVALVRLINGDD